MKIRVESRREKETRLGKWHVWFAWYPIFVKEPRTFVWFDYVERKGVYSYAWYWDYRHCTGQGVSNG